MHILPYESKFLPQVLELSKRSDSTPRSEATWNGNHMTAVLAFDQEKLIGMIPFEPRSFKFSSSLNLKVLWVSGAHVDEAYRSLGIGKAMDDKITEFFPDTQGVLAYRQDEESRAYQWYMKTGYRPMCLIESFKKSVEPAKAKSNHRVYDTKEQVAGFGEQMIKLSNAVALASAWDGGYPGRTASFWKNVYESHYYKDFYKYSLISIEDRGDWKAYAFVGETSLRDGIKRLDILELICLLEKQLLQDLFAAIEDVATKRKLAEVRIQCSASDSLKPLILKEGFTKRWETNILGKLRKVPYPQRNWKYFQVDYI